MSARTMSREAARAAWTWMRSDKGLLLWAVLVGIASGLLAVLMKQSVGGLRVVMFAVQSWVGGSWFLALGPVLGLAATAYVVQRVLGGDHPGPGIPSTLHAISTRRGRMKRDIRGATALPIYGCRLRFYSCDSVGCIHRIKKWVLVYLLSS